jgi:hypothetical protein
MPCDVAGWWGAAGTQPRLVLDGSSLCARGARVASAHAAGPPVRPAPPHPACLRSEAMQGLCRIREGGGCGARVTSGRSRALKARGCWASRVCATACGPDNACSRMMFPGAAATGGMLLPCMVACEGQAGRGTQSCLDLPPKAPWVGVPTWCASREKCSAELAACAGERPLQPGAFASCAPRCAAARASFPGLHGSCSKALAPVGWCVAWWGPLACHEPGHHPSVPGAQCRAAVLHCGSAPLESAGSLRWALTGAGVGLGGCDTWLDSAK